MIRALVAFAAGLWLVSAPVLAAPLGSAGKNAETLSNASGPRLAKGGKKKKPVEKSPPQEKADPEPARSDPRPTSPDPPVQTEPGGRRGMRRIELDERLVQGQTNKANAIYLFERRESALRSLLKKRTDFHEEMDETLE